uniref:Uncharacterized protein n=1 Tax=Rhipicephalus microplus TaxID=6941 RepID=A0A6G5AGN7_RHIMP
MLGPHMRTLVKSLLVLCDTEYNHKNLQLKHHLQKAAILLSEYVCFRTTSEQKLLKQEVPKDSKPSSEQSTQSEYRSSQKYDNCSFNLHKYSAMTVRSCHERSSFLNAKRLLVIVMHFDCCYLSTCILSLVCKCKVSVCDRDAL